MQTQAYSLIGIVQTAIKKITLRETIHSCLHCSVLYSQRTFTEFVLIINITVLCTSTVHSEFLSKAKKQPGKVYVLFHFQKLNGEAKQVSPFFVSDVFVDHSLDFL